MDWKRLLDEGVYPTKAALAPAEGVSRVATYPSPGGYHISRQVEPAATNEPFCCAGE